MRKLLDIEFLGLPPTANHIYRTSHRSFRYKTSEARAWQTQIIEIIKKSYQEPPFMGRVVLQITITTHDKRRWDLDNRIKALQDCLAPAGVIKDDSQIWGIYIKRKLAQKTSTKIILKTLDIVLH